MFPEGTETYGLSTLEQVSPEGLWPIERLQAGTGENWEDNRPAEWNSYWLTTASISYSPSLLGERVVELGMKELK